MWWWDDILEVPLQDVTKVNNDDQLEHEEESIQQESNQSDLPQEWRTCRDHPIDKVIGDISQRVVEKI